MLLKVTCTAVVQLYRSLDNSKLSLFVQLAAAAHHGSS